jgi:tRNA threonylcarbamoyladenosine biosynthesis protein TsaB
MDGAVRAVTIIEGRRTLSRRLMSVIDRLFVDNGLTLQTLSGLAVGIGPGSFTGLRVGLTTMKTFAQVTRLPIVGVNTLMAFAYEARADIVVIATPSRRGEVYASIVDHGVPGQPFAASAADVAGRCREAASRGSVLLCGDPRAVDEISANGLPSIPTLSAKWPSPDSIATLAATRLAAGDVDDAIALVPAYVAAPAISTPRDTSILQDRR